MRYATYEAVRGIDLEGEHGEIVAFLGPNGAGKTTTTESLEGFRKRTGGEVGDHSSIEGRRGPALSPGDPRHRSVETPDCADTGLSLRLPRSGRVDLCTATDACVRRRADRD